jgi:hypothetical protein
MRLTITGVVGLRKSVSPAFRYSEWPSKSMSSPSRPYRSMIADTDLTNASRAAVEVSCTWPFAPPMEISTFLPCACFARMAAVNSASDSTFGHSAAGHSVNRMSPEVGVVGSPNARFTMSHAAGTSAIRT